MDVNDYSKLIHRTAVRDLRIRERVKGMVVAGMTKEAAFKVIQREFHIGREAVVKICKGL